MSFNENEIRPKDLMAQLAIEVEADRRYLVDRKTQFVSANCPVCDSTGDACFEKKEIQYKKCRQCRTVFVDPRPSESLLHAFYVQSRTYRYWNNHIFPASEGSRAAKIFEPRVDRVLGFCDQYKTRCGTLLEIGAGFGTFCNVMTKRNKFERIIALEMTPDLAESCRARGLEVIESPVETVDLPDHSIDVIVAFETLEHLYSPVAFMKSCRRLLSPSGLLVLTCPSGEGFDVLTLGIASDTIDHEHLNYMNPDSMQLLAKRTGFSSLEVLTPGVLDVDIVRNKFLEGSVSLADQPWIRHLLVDRWEASGARFQEFLSSNQMSSHMWMVATAHENDRST